MNTTHINTPESHTYWACVVELDRNPSSWHIYCHDTKREALAQMEEEATMNQLECEVLPTARALKKYPDATIS